MTFDRNLGMLLLAIWLVLYGLGVLFALVVPAWVMGLAALASGVLLLLNR